MAIWMKLPEPDKDKLTAFLQQTYPEDHNVAFDSDGLATLIELPTVDDGEMATIVADLQKQFPGAFSE